MPEPKRIARESIPAALEKALRYRLLGEPSQAESICRDVLAVDPGNQQARITLVLALTDQFAREFATVLDQARGEAEQLEGQYEREYYNGIISERWGKAQIARDMPIDGALAWISEAMRCYERAEAISPPNDPDAVLRWNTCARLLDRYEHLRSTEVEATRDVHADYGDDVPLR
jgi:hypothetical protein